MQGEGQAGFLSTLSGFFAGADESSAIRRRLMFGASGLLALRLAFGGLSFIVAVLLARMLGKYAFGLYNYAFAWVMLFCVPAAAGMDQLLIREIAAYQVASDWNSMR